MKVRTFVDNNAGPPLLWNVHDHRSLGCEKKRVKSRHESKRGFDFQLRNADIDDTCKVHCRFRLWEPLCDYWVMRRYGTPTEQTPDLLAPTKKNNQIRLYFMSQQRLYFQILGYPR